MAHVCMNLALLAASVQVRNLSAEANVMSLNVFDYTMCYSNICVYLTQRVRSSCVRCNWTHHSFDLRDPELYWWPAALVKFRTYRCMPTCVSSSFSISNVFVYLYCTMRSQYSQCAHTCHSFHLRAHELPGWPAARVIIEIQYDTHIYK